MKFRGKGGAIFHIVSRCERRRKEETGVGEFNEFRVIYFPVMAVFIYKINR